MDSSLFQRLRIEKHEVRHVSWFHPRIPTSWFVTNKTQDIENSVRHDALLVTFTVQTILKHNDVAHKIQLLKVSSYGGLLIIPTSFLMFASQTNNHFFSLVLEIDINVRVPAGIRGSIKFLRTQILKRCTILKKICRSKNLITLTFRN